MFEPLFNTVNPDFGADFYELGEVQNMLELLFNTGYLAYGEPATHLDTSTQTADSFSILFVHRELENETNVCYRAYTSYT